jgi:drug/metabolite transporter (DMT)-like permease
MLLPLLLGPGVKKINGNLSFELGFLLFCAYQFQARELVTESASQGSIMLAVYILLVPVVEVLFGRAFTAKKVISLGVAICGIALLQAGVLQFWYAYSVPAALPASTRLAAPGARGTPQCTVP